MRTILGVLTIMCTSAPLAGQDSAADQAAIRAQIASYAAAVNARDVAGVAAVYTPEGDMILGDGPRVSGREAIRRAVAADFGAMPTAQRITLTVVAVRFPTPDGAVAEVAGEFSEGPVRRDRGTNIFLKRDGKWLLTALRVLPAQR